MNILSSLGEGKLGPGHLGPIGVGSPLSQTGADCRKRRSQLPTGVRVCAIGPSRCVRLQSSGRWDLGKAGKAGRLAPGASHLGKTWKAGESLGWGELRKAGESWGKPGKAGESWRKLKKAGGRWEKLGA